MRPVINFRHEIRVQPALFKLPTGPCADHRDPDAAQPAQVKALLCKLLKEDADTGRARKDKPLICLNPAKRLAQPSILRDPPGTDRGQLQHLSAKRPQSPRSLPCEIARTCQHYPDTAERQLVVPLKLTGKAADLPDNDDRGSPRTVRFRLSRERRHRRDDPAL